jgi:hypothetical protein
MFQGEQPLEVGKGKLQNNLAISTLDKTKLASSTVQKHVRVYWAKLPQDQVDTTE